MAGQLVPLALQQPYDFIQVRDVQLLVGALQGLRGYTKNHKVSRVYPLSDKKIHSLLSFASDSD